MNSPSEPTIPIPVTIVHLSEEDARLFIEFQKHHKLIEILESADALSVKGGSVTLHFTNDGEVGSIDVQRRYRLIH